MNSRIPTRACVLAQLNPVSGAVAVALGSTVAAVPIVASATDEITVTATRRETGIQDVPYNIAALSSDTLQEQRLTNLNEVARWVPGLIQVDQGRRAANLVTVRGLNATSVETTDLNINNNGEKVGTYVGEIPVYIDLQLYDIDRVEVLIGPQGTLYGSGTLAGAIRYIPNQPDFENSTLDTHVKGYDLSESDDFGWGADATLNIPIRDNIAWRSTIGYVEEAGFTDYNFLVREAGVSNPQPDFSDPDDVAANLFSVEDADDEETLFFRTALRWAFSDALEATLSYTHQNQDVGGRSINHEAAFGTGQYESAHRFLEPSERENDIVSLEINADLGFATLTSATGLVDYDEEGSRDQTDLLLNFEYGYEFFPEFAAFTLEEVSDQVFTQEVRLVSQNDSRWSWIAGMFYSKFDRSERSREFTPGIPEFFFAPEDLPLPTGDLEYDALLRTDVSETALFGEIGYQFTDRLQVTAGLRWFEYEDFTRITTNIPLVAISSDDSALIDDNDNTWKINASYDLDGLIGGMDAGTVYGTISTGYGLGGVNTFPPCDLPLDPDPSQNICLLPDETSFEIETTTNYEIGLKSQWLDNSLTLNVSLFMIDWEDLQLDTRSVFGDVSIVGNAAEAESKGLELQYNWQINDAWSVYGTYAYTEAELSQYSPNIVGLRFPPLPPLDPNNPTPAEIQDGIRDDAFDGDRLPGTPENQGSINVRYETAFMGDKTLAVNYGVTATSDVITKVGLGSGNELITGEPSGEVLPGYAIHNASVSVSQDQWTATLYANNLTDKFARTGVRTDAEYIDSINGFDLRRYYHNVLRPRVIGLDFRYAFDF